MSRFNHKETDLNLITDQNDLDLIQKYTENWNRANAAGDEAGKRAAHDAAEMIRAMYQYSGGSNGNDYIRLAGENRASGSGGRSYDTSWLDKLNLNDGGYTYDANGKISSALDALLNREKFSYDAASDPLYQQYRKQYTREADRSAEDVLGKAAVMTGGMPSTAAVTASQQASDYQMSQMTDKIPELQQLAYGMYVDKLNADRADLNTLIGLEDNNYNRWLADRNYRYQLGRDLVSDRQYQDQLYYQKERDAIEDARYDTEWQYKLQQAAQAAAQSGTRRSGNVTPTPSEADYEGLFEAAYQSGYPKSYIANNYKKFGFTSSSGAYDGYEDWLDKRENGIDESDLSSSAKRIMSSLEKMRGQRTKEGETPIANTIAVYADQGKLTDAEARFLFSHFGYDPDEWLE